MPDIRTRTLNAYARYSHTDFECLCPIFAHEIFTPAHRIQVIKYLWKETTSLMQTYLDAGAKLEQIKDTNKRFGERNCRSNADRCGWQERNWNNQGYGNMNANELVKSIVVNGKCIHAFD